MKKKTEKKKADCIYFASAMKVVKNYFIINDLQTFFVAADDLYKLNCSFFKLNIYLNGDFLASFQF